MANLVIKGSGATPLSGAGRAGKPSPRGGGSVKPGPSGGAVSPSVAKLREIRKGSRKEVLEKGKGTQGRRRAVEKLLPEPVRDLVYEPLDFDRGQVPETVVSPASTPPTRVWLDPRKAVTGVSYSPRSLPGEIVYRGETPTPEAWVARPAGAGVPRGRVVPGEVPPVSVRDASASLAALESRRAALMGDYDLGLAPAGANVFAPARAARIEVPEGAGLADITYPRGSIGIAKLYHGEDPVGEDPVWDPKAHSITKKEARKVPKQYHGTPAEITVDGGSQLAKLAEVLPRLTDQISVVRDMVKEGINGEPGISVNRKRLERLDRMRLKHGPIDYVLREAYATLGQLPHATRLSGLSHLPVEEREAMLLGVPEGVVKAVAAGPGKGIVAGVRKLDKAVSDVPFVRIVDKLWRSNPEAKFKIRDKARSWLAKHPGVVSAAAYTGAGLGLAYMVSDRNRQVYEEGQRAAASAASGSNGPLGLAVIERVRALDDNLAEVASGRVSESNPLASADGLADVLAGIGGAMSRQVGGLLKSVDPADVKLGETIRRQAADDYNRVYQRLAKVLPSEYMASAMQYAADGGSNVTPEAFAASLGLKDWRSDDAK